jgi:hypothetical protein
MAWTPTPEFIAQVQAQVDAEEAQLAQQAQAQPQQQGWTPTPEFIAQVQADVDAQERMQQQGMLGQLGDVPTQPTAPPQVGFPLALGGATAVPRKTGQSLEAMVRGIPAGAIELGRGAYNALGQLAGGFNKALGLIPGVPDLGTPRISPEQVAPLRNILQPQALRQQHPTASAVGEFIGGAAPLAFIPGSALTKGKFLSQILPRNVALGAAISPLYAPDTPIEQSTLTGAALGGAVAPLVSLATAGRGVIAKLMGGGATPQQVEQAISAAGTARLPIGEAIQSPAFKKLQASILNNIPGSGMQKQYRQATESLTGRLHDQLTKLSPQGIVDIGDIAANTLTKKYNEAKTVSRRLYGDMNTYADQVGHQVSQTKFSQTAKKYADDIEALQKEKPYWGELADNQEFVRFLKGAADMKGKPTPFKMATLEDAELNARISQATMNNDKRMKGMLMSLKKANQSDIDSSIANLGDSKLGSMWQQAKAHYKEYIVPLEEKDILKYTVKGEDPDKLIQSFLKTGQFEKPRQLERLVSHLPEDQRSQLAHFVLTKGQPDNTPAKIMQNFNRLGTKQKNILFTPAERKEISDIGKTAKLLGAEKNEMFVPQTGTRGAYTGIAGSLGYLGAHNPFLAGSAMAAANVAQRALMSDWLRSLYLRSAKRGLTTPKGTALGAVPFASLSELLKKNGSNGS